MESDNNMATQAAPQSLRQKNKTFSWVLVRLMWMACLVFVILLGIALYDPFSWSLSGVILVDNLSLIIGAAVTLFSGIVLSYSARYLAGHQKLRRFLVHCALFACAAIVMVSADHVLLFILAWLAMGMLMAELIGGYTHYLEGAASKSNARNYFLLSTFLLAGGLTILALETGSWSISTITNSIGTADPLMVQISVILLIGAAVIQSALFPFQRWLMSSMTAPTPASALMHAGFVNAGAILLTRTAPVLFASDLLWVLVLVGGIGALIGKFSKFVQANVKQKLACSTTAQMGFMLLQCGLGFFTAAIAHLILHGFYKAYLFLSAGENIGQESPYARSRERWKGWHLPVTIISGLAGGIIFAYTTGKGMELNSGLFLTLVIVLTVIHGTQDLLKQATLPAFSRLIALPILIIPALLVYALIFDGITTLLASVPMASQHVPISWDQVTIGILYLATFLIIELKWYTKSRRLYVQLLNISQPKSSTILQ